MCAMCVIDAREEVKRRKDSLKRGKNDFLRYTIDDIFKKFKFCSFLYFYYHCFPRKFSYRLLIINFIIR